MKKILSILIFASLISFGFASNIEEKLSKSALKAQAYFNRGNDRYDAGNYEGAVKDFNKAIDIDSKFIDKFMPRLLPKAHNHRANAKKKLGDYEGAIKDYDKSIELNPHSVWVYYNRGELNIILGRYEEAIKDYDKVVRILPNDDFTYYKRGIAKAKAKKYKEAILDYNIAIQIDPNYFKAYNKRGDARFDSKHYQDAIIDYKKAIKIDRHNIHARIGLRRVKQQKKHEMNELIMRKLFSSIPKNIFDYYNPSIIVFKKSLILKNHASLYYNTKLMKKVMKEARRKKIIDSYIHTLELDYKHAKTYNDMGNSKMISKHYTEAIKDYDKAVKLAPMEIHGYKNRGNARLKLGDYEEARKDFIKAKELAEEQKKSEILKAIDKNLKEVEKAEEKFLL
jgi:tetratricopeptide (TPR) repeat protein